MEVALSPNDVKDATKDDEATRFVQTSKACDQTLVALVFLTVKADDIPFSPGKEAYCRRDSFDTVEYDIGWAFLVEH